MTAIHRPAIPYANKVDSKEERRDSCSATEEEGRVASLAKELEMPRGAFSYVGSLRVSIVQTWNLFSTGSLEGGA